MTPVKKKEFTLFGLSLCLTLLVVNNIRINAIHKAHTSPIPASNSPVVKLVPVIDPNYVQNPYEAQERLKAQGYYHGRIDGLWGPETDKAYCNWCGVQAIRRAEK